MDVTFFETPRPRMPDADSPDTPSARSPQAADTGTAAETCGLSPSRSSVETADATGRASPEAAANGRTAAREEILARYRQLRELNVRFQSEALNKVPTDIFLDRARHIGLAWRKALVTDDIEQLCLVFDLSLYTAPRGRARAIDRYARQANVAPGTDEAMMLGAMCRPRFSIWEVERRHEAAGLIVEDILREERLWLVDEGLEQSVPDGGKFAGRLIAADGFAMTTGMAVPIDEAALALAILELSHLRGSPDAVANDRRFATAIYRIAVRDRTGVGIRLLRAALSEARRSRLGLDVAGLARA